MTTEQLNEAALEANNAQKDVKAAIVTVSRENGIKVTFRGRVTRVKLADGTTGKAKWDPTDEYNALIGYQVAKERAEVRAAEKQATALRNRTRRF